MTVLRIGKASRFYGAGFAEADARPRDKTLRFGVRMCARDDDGRAAAGDLLAVLERRRGD